MSHIGRKIAVINAATAWAEAIREHGPDAASPFRANFLTALDDALTATDAGAVGDVDALERLRGLVDAMLDGSPERHYAAIRALRADRDARKAGRRMSEDTHRWELRREPDNGTVLIRLFDNDPPEEWPGWEPVIGNVRWYRDGVPFGPILDGFPVTGWR